jgi:coenzyme F420-reducing hydrogenase delta subunit
MSAGEPDEFVKAVTNMTQRIKELGPNPKFNGN